MTNYELGNDILHNLVDRMNELANECSYEQRMIAELLKDLALDFGPVVNRLMGDGSVGCPTRDKPSHNWYYFNPHKNFLKV